jgi:hypothetical protein
MRSASATAAVVYSGGVWKTPNPRAGISTLLFSFSVGVMPLSSGVPFRWLQERMRHRDYKATEIYADYARLRESEMIDRAFRPQSDDDEEPDGEGAS